MKLARLFAAVALAGLAGCGPRQFAEPPKTYPVKGRVTVGGQPLSGGMLTCVLTTDLDKYGPSEAPAVVNPDGTFEPVLFNGKPGLYPGRWKVVVSSTSAYKDGKRVAARPAVPAKYTREETSDLYIDVKEGENTPAVVLR